MVAGSDGKETINQSGTGGSRTGYIKETRSNWGVTVVICDFKWRWYSIEGIKNTIVPESRKNISGGGHGATVKMSMEITIIKLEMIQFEHGVKLRGISAELR
jgi:hypothetical protein